MMSELRNPQQYQALTIIAAVPDVPKREIAIAFRGAEEETYDLIVAVPAGIIASAVVQLHEACARLDAQVQDKAAVMQPLNLLGAEVANPILGKCAIVLRAGAFHLPALLSKEAAIQIVETLEKAIESLNNPPTIPRQLS